MSHRAYTRFMILASVIVFGGVALVLITAIAGLF